MSRFSGFPAHVETYLGRVRGAESNETTQLHNRTTRDRGYHLVYVDNEQTQQIAIVTSGLRLKQAGAPLPQELVCTLHSAQEDAARHLVATIAELLTESESRVGYGALIMNDRPLLENSDICGALAAPHPHLSEEFDTLHDQAGQPVLQLVTLLPITRGEAQLVSRYGTDVLYNRWEDTETDLLSVYRASAG